MGTYELVVTSMISIMNMISQKSTKISFINHCSKENNKKLDALATSTYKCKFHDFITKQAASSPSFQFPNVQLKSTPPVPLH